MFEVGDYVVYVKDGARGLVIKVEADLCQVIWEDLFVSWEHRESLRMDEDL